MLLSANLCSHHPLSNADAVRAGAAYGHHERARHRDAAHLHDSDGRGDCGRRRFVVEDAIGWGIVGVWIGIASGMLAVYLYPDLPIF